MNNFFGFIEIDIGTCWKLFIWLSPELIQEIFAFLKNLNYIFIIFSFCNHHLN